VPELMDTLSGSPREVVIIDWPGFRRSSSAWMSAAESSTPAGQPDTVQPIASPWDSPNVVTWKSRPNRFPFIVVYRGGTHLTLATGPAGIPGVV